MGKPVKFGSKFRSVKWCSVKVRGRKVKVWVKAKSCDKVFVSPPFPPWGRTVPKKWKVVKKGRVVCVL